MRRKSGSSILKLLLILAITTPGLSWQRHHSNKEADVVLLEQNPLAKLAHTRTIRGVMIGQHWLTKATLEQRLASLKKR